MDDEISYTDSTLYFSIKICSLKSDIFNGISEIILSNIDLFKGEDGDDGIKTIQLCIGDEISIKGREFWRFMLSSFPETPELMLKFLTKKFDLFSIDNGSLPYEDDGHGMGLTTFVPFFEKMRCPTFSKGRKPKGEILDLCLLFVKYFKNWDLDFETDQDQCIYTLLEKLSSNELDDSYIDLLFYRLNNGQYSLVSCTYSRLSYLLGEVRSQDYILKRIIDKFIDDRLSKNEKLDVSYIKWLCAPIYGSNNDLIDEVISYSSNYLELENRYPSLEFKTIFLQEQCDAYRKYIKKSDGRIRPTMKTGFHTYDYIDKSWTSMGSP